MYGDLWKRERKRTMWILYAAGSSFFAGITAILAMCGIRKTDSNVATAIRTVIVLLFSWLMVLVTGTGEGIRQIDSRTFLFLVLSDWRQGHPGCVIFMLCKKGILTKLCPLICPARG